MKRRTVIKASLGAMVGLAGCSGIQEQFEFTAEPASFADSAVEDAGYEALEQREIVEEQEVEAAGVTRKLVVTNYAQGYKRTVTIKGEDRNLVGAAVFSTPSMEVVGEEFNPIADEDPSDLIERARDRIEEQIESGEIRDISKIEDRNRTILGAETTVTEFEAVTEVEDEELTIRVLLTKVEHDDDYILVAGGFPEEIADEERARVQNLMDSVEHGGE